MKMLFSTFIMVLSVGQAAMAILPKTNNQPKELHLHGTISRSQTCKTGYSFRGSSHEDEKRFTALCVTIPANLTMGIKARQEYNEDLAELVGKGVTAEPPTIIDFLLSNEAILSAVKTGDQVVVNSFDVSGED